jgi:hypothetical protein
MDESLGTFDEQIRKERERLARERDANASGDGGAAEGGEGGDGTEGGGGGPAAGGVTSESGDASQGNGEGESDGGMKSDGARPEGTGGGGAGGAGSKGQGPSTTPKNIPDGRDDDVIARQIREAAEKETDPELRDKLWKEYIEYKKNTQGR